MSKGDLTRKVTDFDQSEEKSSVLFGTSPSHTEDKNLTTKTNYVNNVALILKNTLNNFISKKTSFRAIKMLNTLLTLRL